MALTGVLSREQHNQSGATRLMPSHAPSPGTTPRRYCFCSNRNTDPCLTRLREFPAERRRALSCLWSASCPESNATRAERHGQWPNALARTFTQNHPASALVLKQPKYGSVKKIKMARSSRRCRRERGGLEHMKEFAAEDAAWICGGYGKEKIIGNETAQARASRLPP